MSNRARRTPASRSQRQRQQQQRAAERTRRVRIVAAVGALVVIAAVLAIVLASGGGDEGEDGPELAFNGADLPAFTDGADPAVGTKAPLFVTEDISGNRVVTGGGGGPNDTAKVIVFVAHWCPTCQREVPRLAAWLRANEVPDGVEVVTVSTFPDASRGNYPPSAWFAEVDWPLPVLVDSGAGDIATAFGMGSVPSWVVLDKTNFGLTRRSGALTDADWEELLNLAGTGT